MAPFALPVLALVVMLALWWRRGRDPAEMAVDVRYEPPDDLSPAACGLLLDTSVRLRHVTATLVDLAARGHLSIEAVEPPPDDDLEHDFLFRPASDPSAWDQLTDHESSLLHLFFSPRDAGPADPGPADWLLRETVGAPGGRESLRMSDLGQPFRPIQGTGTIFDELSERGYFASRPAWVRLRYLGGALLVAALGSGAAARPLEYASVGAAAVIIAGIGWYMPARTTKGRRAAEEVIGFREYLERTEADRLERSVERPADFDRSLAYAIALGVESRWSDALDDLYGDRVETVEDASEDDLRQLLHSSIESLRRFLEADGESTDA
ncbi:MAG: DUF2207 domain-containing protein, partial [Gemmatimonadota bacterium]|nr:DUF2207 domain-containing protein [Gemmatimonadota bacterium]